MQPDKVFILLVNKQLEPHGVTYDDVVKDPDWLKKYFFDSKEKQEEYRKWAIEEIRRKLRVNKKTAENEFNWFYFNHGLSVR